MTLKINTLKVLIFGFIAMILSTSNLFADERESFIVDMTHTFYAKALCPNVDILYDGFVTVAKIKNLDPTIVEAVRNGVLFIDTNGKSGKIPPDDIMGEIRFAVILVAVDRKELGDESWCNHRLKFLKERGFVANSTKELTPPLVELQKAIDEQFSEMKKAMPLQVSTISRLTNVVRSGMTLRYSYEDNVQYLSATDEFKNKIAYDATKFQCNGTNTRLLIDYGFSMLGIHFDKNGKFITQFYIDKKSCL